MYLKCGCIVLLNIQASCITFKREARLSMNAHQLLGSVTEDRAILFLGTTTKPVSSWSKKLCSFHGGSYPANWDSEDKWPEAPPWSLEIEVETVLCSRHIQSLVSLASCLWQFPSPKNKILTVAKSHCRNNWHTQAFLLLRCSSQHVGAKRRRGL